MPLSLTANDLKTLFPAYLEMDHAGTIVANGPSLDRHTNQHIIGHPLLETFDIVRPLGITSHPRLLIDNQILILRHKDIENLQLRGILKKCTSTYVFLAGHLPDLSEQKETLKYQFVDFSPFDGTQDIFLAAQIRKGLLDDTKTLVKKLNKEKLSAESANHAKSSFLACMSHEIRTPLNGILGFTTLLSKTDVTAEQEEMLHTIQESGENLLMILNDILDLSKVDAGKLHIENIPFSLQEALDSLVKIYSLKALDKSIELKVNFPSELLNKKFIGDPNRIRQILNNFISNAIKFTSEGSVEISITEEPSTTEEKSLVTLSVKDTGIGIEADALENLFTPFTQADSTINRRFGGTGLGLSISKSLTELMDGTIKVTSTYGEGSCFSAKLPLKVSKKQIVQGANNPPIQLSKKTHNAEKLHLLVAEDNLANQKVIGAFLDLLDYSYEITANGKEAVELFEKKQFDIILMDAQMPVMDGIEATKKIRELEGNGQRIPIIAVTANAMPDDVSSYLASGFDHHVAKPINIEELSSILDSFNRPEQMSVISN